MKTKFIVCLAIIGMMWFSCKTEEDKIKEDVTKFNTFADSILGYNKYYVEVLYGDTDIFEIKDPSNPELIFRDSAIQLHSNIFDTATSYTKTEMAPVLEKYNNWEHQLDSLKPKMDKQTMSLFESIKAKINVIKQPIK